jgi:hypothetical protein
MKAPGKDDKMGTDKSEDGKGDSVGVWVIGLGDVPSGTFYAKVAEKNDCDADRSKDVLLKH